MRRNLAHFREEAMSKTLHAIYDGKVLRPLEETDLQPNRRYRVTVEEDNSAGKQAEDVYPLSALLDLAADLGVEDLAASHDRYAHRRIED
jgi:predicted DNA-binding antitoxin AbrB/MazE fold protein